MELVEKMLGSAEIVYHKKPNCPIFILSTQREGQPYNFSEKVLLLMFAIAPQRLVIERTNVTLENVWISLLQ